NVTGVQTCALPIYREYSIEEYKGVENTEEITLISKAVGGSSSRWRLRRLLPNPLTPFPSTPLLLIWDPASMFLDPRCIVAGQSVARSTFRGCSNFVSDLVRGRFDTAKRVPSPLLDTTEIDFWMVARARM